MVEARSRGESRYKGPPKHRKDSIQRPALVDFVQRALLLARFRRVIVRRSCNRTLLFFSNFRLFLYDSSCHFNILLREIFVPNILKSYIEKWSKCLLARVKIVTWTRRVTYVNWNHRLKMTRKRHKNMILQLGIWFFFLFVLSWVRYMKMDKKKRWITFVNYIIVWKIRIIYLIKKWIINKNINEWVFISKYLYNYYRKC